MRGKADPIPRGCGVRVWLSVGTTSTCSLRPRSRFLLPLNNQRPYRRPPCALLLETLRRPRARGKRSGPRIPSLKSVLRPTNILTRKGRPKPLAKPPLPPPQLPPRKTARRLRLSFCKSPNPPRKPSRPSTKRSDLRTNFERLVANAEERLRTEPDPRVRATLAQKIELLKLDINTTNSELQTLQKALVDYQHGKNPGASMPDGQPNPTDQPKPSAEHDNTVVPG
jgi:hypothetical protein